MKVAIPLLIEQYLKLAEKNDIKGIDLLLNEDDSLPKALTVTLRSNLASREYFAYIAPDKLELTPYGKDWFTTLLNSYKLPAEVAKEITRTGQLPEGHRLLRTGNVREVIYKQDGSKENKSYSYHHVLIEGEEYKIIVLGKNIKAKHVGSHAKDSSDTF